MGAARKSNRSHTARWSCRSYSSDQYNGVSRAKTCEIPNFFSARETVAVARNAMATRFEIILHGERKVSLRAAAEEALTEIERLGAQLSLYNPTSEISHINACAAQSPVRVETTLFRL